MIEKIIQRLQAEAEEHKKYWDEFDDEDSFGAMNATLKAISIVQEVAKEYGKDTNVHSRCDTCTHNVADEVPPICYMCCKGIEDNYQRKGE